MSKPDPRALRDAFGAFLTGVTVVTTHDADGAPIGFTANSFASVSLEPPLLLVCLARTSRNFGPLTQAPGFAVNILSQGQKEVSNTFARPVEDRFATVDWTVGPNGSPILSDVAAWFDCTMHQIVDGGDHVVLLGRIEAFCNGQLNGLGYARGGYFVPELAQKAVSVASSETGTIAGTVATQAGQVLLLRGPAGRFALPSCVLASGEGPDQLQTFVGELAGVTASLGFIYSLYEDRKTGKQHLVYRCELGPGDIRTGQLFPVDALPLDNLVDAPTADVLSRYASESVLGNFGMYVGDEQSGKVVSVGKGSS
ncbi:flavin reductase family protein [Mesorhizobium amorphae]|uniref:flavin reductase family protein n=1 Tax=Mesorhizobium amorphae TaxID=71433 RepID=UPI001185B29D|nr:flavin reductase [Mesorhizobium amorphae]